MVSVTALLIAAGESSRMGRPKSLLQWQGVPLIQYQIQALATAGVSRLIVVLGYQVESISPFVHGAKNLCVTINPRYREGKTTSIKLGLTEVDKSADGVLLLAVDQPRPPWVHQRLLQAFSQRQGLITQPLYRTKRGHPPLFAASLLPELLAITEEGQGVHEVVQRYRGATELVPFDSPVVLLDLNAEDDLLRGQELFAQEPLPSDRNQR